MKLDSNIINLNSFELRSKRAIKPKEWAKRCQKVKWVSWFVAEWSFMQFHIILDCYYLDIVGQKVGKTRDQTCRRSLLGSLYIRWIWTGSFSLFWSTPLMHLSFIITGRSRFILCDPFNPSTYWSVEFCCMWHLWPESHITCWHDEFSQLLYEVIRFQRFGFLPGFSRLLVPNLHERPEHFGASAS